MNDSLVILGRQPALGIAELESLYGAHNVRLVGREAARIHREPGTITFERLGGAMKLCAILTTLHTPAWHDVQRFLQQSASTYAAQLPDGKIQLGLSVYDMTVSPQQIMASGLTAKKALRALSRSVRLIPNNEQALNSAQVLHNHLTGTTGIELVFIRDGQSIICAKTVAVQDITAYTLRDRGRPKRDTRVGMLPPKLAQTLINLASGQEQPSATPGKTKRVLDPFCGTGVVLQEALLMGYDVLGTDLEPRMVEYSSANLQWLGERYKINQQYLLAIGDATDFYWEQPVDLVACETYLGQPFNTFPGIEKVEQVRGTCNLIIERFLRNIGTQIKSGTRLCVAVPAWQQKPGRFIHLPFLDHLDKLGYNRLSFEHVRTEDLVYYREEQTVGRELLVITRK